MFKYLELVAKKLIKYLSMAPEEWLNFIQNATKTAIIQDGKVFTKIYFKV